MKRQGSTRRSQGIVQVALFAALIIVMASIPFLGYIPLGFTRATIIHIPVILGSILLGPRKGAVLGGIFGLTSLAVNTFTPNATSFVFSPFYSLGDVHGNFASLIICLVPRILTGVIPYFVYRFVCRILGDTATKKRVALGIAGFCGAMTNTLLVMNLIYLFFGDSYGAAKGVAGNAIYPLILSIIGINGIPEAIVATLLVAIIGQPLLRFTAAKHT